MVHPMKGMARSSDPKWLGRLQKATGGGVALGRRGNKESATFSKTDDTVPTTTRFLPKYDFDYDPTGGKGTGQMTNFGESDEIQSHKRSLDNPINDRKRGGKIEADDSDHDRPRQERLSDPVGNLGASDRWSREFGSPLPKSRMRDLSDAGEGMSNNDYKRGGRAKRK